MATIENLTHGDLPAFLETLDETELIGQQLVQQGAIHAVQFLLQHGCDPAIAGAMLASLQNCMAQVTEVAERKGFRKLFDTVTPAGLH